MEKEEWINRRTADPNKIGKLWWNKMYNQCHLPMEKERRYHEILKTR